jgi:HK97 family phage portal protein
MSLLGRFDGVASLFGLRPKSAPRRARPALPDFWHAIGAGGAWGSGIPDPSLYAGQAAYYTRSPAFYAAVNRIAEAGAMAPAGVFASPAPDAAPIPDHPLLDLLRRPAPNMEWLSLDRFSLVESILASLAVTGNAYLYLGGRRSPTQPPAMLLPLRTDRLAPVGSQETGLAHYTYAIDGKEWHISPADVIHLRRWHPLNDWVGLSQVEPAYFPLATDQAAQRHNWAVFKNQARLSFVVESDQSHVDPAEKELMEQYILETFTGDPLKAGKVAFFWSGFKARDVGMNLRDAEYTEGRKLNRTDILMTTGVHPALLMAEDVPLANARVAEYLFAKYTLLPALMRIQNRFNAELTPLYGEGHELRFLDVVPRDIEQELREQEAYLDRGVMTPNQVRRARGWEPVPWGDVPASLAERAVTPADVRRWMGLGEE